MLSKLLPSQICTFEICKKSFGLILCLEKNLNSMLAGLLDGKLVASLVNCTKSSGQKFLHGLIFKKGFEPEGTGCVCVTGGKFSNDISVGRPFAGSA